MPTNIDSLRSALARSPENVPLSLLYAHECVEELDLAEARRVYDRILRSAPHHLEASLGIARVLFMEGRTSEAAVRVECLLREKPDFAAAHLFLSRVHLSENDRRKALEHFRIAREKDPSAADPALEKELGSAAAKIMISLAPEQDPSGNGFGFESRDSDDGFDEDDDNMDFDALSLCRVERPEERLSDVVGLEEVKKAIRLSILAPSKNAELFKAYGQRAGGGILLYGPPGCGKSLLATAAAGEADAAFFHPAPHEILDAYPGSSERSLHHLFEMARASAPSILFLDEIEAFATDRDDAGDLGRNLVSQLLYELGNPGKRNDGLLTIAATSTPWQVDPAVGRPGRFGKTIFVPPPDFEARKAIIARLAAKRPVDHFDVDAIATATTGFSGADLEQVFNNAVAVVLDKALDEEKVVPLTTDHVLKAASEITPSVDNWFDTARRNLREGRRGVMDPKVLVGNKGR